MLENFIEKLCAVMGEESFVKNKDGSYTLELADELEIVMQENPEWGISFFSVLTELPEASRKEFELKALAANLFGAGTGDNVLGLNKEGDKLTLSRCLPEEVSYQEFYNYLENFANYASVWREDTKVYVG